MLRTHNYSRIRKLQFLSLPALGFMLTVSSIAASDRTISDFSGNCARFAFVPDLKAKRSQLAEYIQKSKGYVVYRKEAGEKGFSQVYAADFTEDAAQIADILQMDLDIPDKDVNGYKIFSERFGVRDFVRRSALAMALSIYNPRAVALLGTGYEDCKVDKSKSYEYYVSYLAGPKLFQFPATPLQIRFSAFTIVPPKIEKIIPGEGSAEIHFVPERLREKRSGGIVAGYNLYRRAGNKTERVNKLTLVNVSKKPKIIVDARQLVKGQKYSFFTTAVSFSGAESNPGPETEFVARSLIAPDPVQKVEVKPVHAGLEITWTKHADPEVTGYHVYEASGKKTGNPQDQFKRVNKVLIPADQTTFTHFFTLSSRRYSYRVTALNKWGNESAMSAAGFITYNNMESPDAPEITEINASPKGVKIGWNFKPQFPIKGFILYRSASTKDNAMALDVKLSPRDRSCIDKTALPGGNYWYSLRAISKNRVLGTYSAPKQILLAEKGDSKGPHSVTFNEIQEGILLSWKPPLHSIFHEYKIYRKIGKGKIELLNAEELPVTNSRFLDKGTRRAVDEITYEIATIDASGRERGTRTVIRVPAMQIQLIVPEVHIVRHGNSLRFVWSQDSDRHLSIYELYCKHEQDKDFKKVAQAKGEKGMVEVAKLRKGNLTYYVKKVSRYAASPVVSNLIRVEI
ncbi:MAG: fibronectin type III domain-containing protein [Spirochaetota bacterium]